MKAKIYCIALGYPFGTLVNGAKVILYQVEFNDLIYHLNISSYQLWNLCLTGIALEKLIEKNETQDVIWIKEQIDYLERNKLMLLLDLNKTEDFYNRMSNYIAVRQGIGQGVQENNKYYVHTYGLIEINEVEYIIWIQVNNKRTIYEITQEYCKHFNVNQDLGRDEVIEAILVLIAKGLIFLVGAKND